jgi:tRNA-uridine 2-sulfurtransferase
MSFLDPENTNILSNYNCTGKDSSLFSKEKVIYYCLIKDGIIKEISFSAFGGSLLISASEFIARIAKNRTFFNAAKISKAEIKKNFPDILIDKVGPADVALGAFRQMLSSYIPLLIKEKKVPEQERTAAVAMSGGIDSLIAAKILKDRGYSLMGVTMKIIPDHMLSLEERITSWISSDIESAAIACRLLDIPHLIIDLRDIFKEKIIEPFCRSYIEGMTPNPCIDCNKYIKFGHLLQICRKLGAKYMATGHYCIIEKNYKDNSFLIRKGIDQLKEQSYFLWKLNQSQISHIKTPLGFFTKEDIKKKLKESYSFAVPEEESQDICFIKGKSYHELLNNCKEKIKKGRIIDIHGRYLGQHRGFPYYTVGQRKGLGISHSEPLYVKKIIPEKNTIIVSEKKDLASESTVIKSVNFISGKPPSKEFTADVKIRYNGKPVPAKILIKECNTAIINFKEPVESLTPGQSAVFYDDDILIGGGIIIGLQHKQFIKKSSIRKS